jgi:Fe-S cluster assembly scaffold protein SufB
MAGHVLRQHVEVSDDDRTVATAEVTTSEGSGGTARVSLRAEPGHITPGCRASLVDAVLNLPRGAAKRTRGGGIPARRWRVTAPASGALRGRQHPPGRVERAPQCEPSEGCTAPVYSSDSLHSAVVEIIVKKDAHCRYTTIQNWSNNVYNLVTRRVMAQAGASMEWVDGNIGSKVTMKYPAVYLMGEHARGESLSVAFAGEGQHQDAGAKRVHCAPNTSSQIISKSVASPGGRTSYRGLVQVQEGAAHSRSTVKCDALLLDTVSRSDTYPYVDIREDDVEMGHEASVSKISEDQLFYLMSRGMTEDEAAATIVRGFVEPIARERPMEYALELNRLIELKMEGAVG